MNEHLCEPHERGVTQSHQPSAQASEGEREGLKAAFTSGDFDAMDALGGWRGIAESALPTIVFIVSFLVTKDALVSGLGALVVSVLFLLVRIGQKAPVAPALSGAVVALLGALVAAKTGSGADFYLPGLVINGVYAVALSITVLIGHPVVGYVAAALDRRAAPWRLGAGSRKIYTLATVAYAAFFALKVAVQAPLFLLGQVEALGIAKLVMGLPAFALMTWLIYLMHRRAVLLMTPVHGAGDQEQRA